jgi:hypothetical protein
MRPHLQLVPHQGPPQPIGQPLLPLPRDPPDMSDQPSIILHPPPDFVNTLLVAGVDPALDLVVAVVAIADSGVLCERIWEGFGAGSG